MEVHALGVLESSTFSYHHLYFSSKIVKKRTANKESNRDLHGTQICEFMFPLLL
uniref:Uncharacterized protein n=1 Tax=Helianthus annuus TaxID=4232 RepID=A0A251T5R2_HELAN